MSPTVVLKGDGQSVYSLSPYQKIVIGSLCGVLIFQAIMMLLFFFFKEDWIWKAMLIFSGGISAGGYLLACRSMWQIEKYEKKFAQAIWEKYGVNIFDSKERNFMSFYYENQKEIDGIFTDLKKDQLKIYLKDTVTHINNYTPSPPKEDWEKKFQKNG
jgi:hypothetical protein